MYSFQTTQPWVFQTIWIIFYEQRSIKVNWLKEALHKVKLEEYLKRNLQDRKKQLESRVFNIQCSISRFKYSSHLSFTLVLKVSSHLLFSKTVITRNRQSIWSRSTKTMKLTHQKTSRFYQQFWILIKKYF